MYGVPGEGMSNIHANNIQHSKHFNSHNQLESSRIRKSGNSRAIAQLSGHVLASSSPGDWSAATRIRAAAFVVSAICLGTALSSDAPTRDVRLPDFCGAPSGLTCL